MRDVKVGSGARVTLDGGSLALKVGRRGEPSLSPTDTMFDSPTRGNSGQ